MALSFAPSGLMSVNLNDPLVKEFISNSAGEGAYRIVKSLDRGKTDEQIARSTKLQVNDIRAALNRLHYLGIILYTKVKSKSSNWYTYTWFVKKERIDELLKDRYKDELDKLQQRLAFEQTYTFFKCGNGCDKLAFEVAFEYNFKCPECGNAMESMDANTHRRETDKRIKQLKKIIG